MDVYRGIGLAAFVVSLVWLIAGVLYDSKKSVLYWAVGVVLGLVDLLSSMLIK